MGLFSHVVGRAASLGVLALGRQLLVASDPLLWVYPPSAGLFPDIPPLQCELPTLHLDPPLPTQVAGRVCCSGRTVGLH